MDQLPLIRALSYPFVEDHLHQTLKQDETSCVQWSPEPGVMRGPEQERKCMHPAQCAAPGEMGNETEAHCESATPPRPQRAAGDVRDRLGSRHSARRVGPWRRRNHRPPGSPSPNRRAGRAGGERPSLRLPVPARLRDADGKAPTYGSGRTPRRCAVQRAVTRSPWSSIRESGFVEFRV